VVGPGLARQLYLGDERIDAASALRIGLVGVVVPAAELTARVSALAARLAAAPAHVVRLMKANLNDGDVLDLEQHLDRENARFVEARLTH